MTSNSFLQKATFAAGCFWGAEETFLKSGKVAHTMVGYTGGAQVPLVNYEQVCTGRTGHAEAVEVQYDPAETSYSELLALFWGSHNPTTLNRQGPDVGTQYRSAIFYHTEEQHEQALKSKESLEKDDPTFKEHPIVTQIVPAVKFYPAEEYHQQYLRKNGRAFCHFA